jgi:hypothetical protein
MAGEPSVTELIRRAERGDAEAADRLFAAMYPERWFRTLGSRALSE